MMDELCKDAAAQYCLFGAGQRRWFVLESLRLSISPDVIDI
jgi:hypothetical protein